MYDFKILEKLKNKTKDLNGVQSVTVVFLGDSVTQGCFEVYLQPDGALETVYETEQSYSAKFKILMDRLYPKAHINIIDSGISGDKAANGAKRLERDVLAYSPDLVVVCYGLNDCTQGDHYIEQYLSGLKNIFSTLKEKNIDVIFMTPNMMNTRLSHTLKDDFLKRLAFDFAELQKVGGRMDRFISAAKDVANVCGVPVCDCYAKWKKWQSCGVDTTALLANALNHPQREMHWFFAYALLETLFS